jgi:hypothetical protein
MQFYGINEDGDGFTQTDIFYDTTCLLISEDYAMNIRVSHAIFLVLSLLANGAVLAQEAQVLNSSYVEARDLWQQLSASSIPPDEKAPYGKRFGNLAEEQRNLWSLAGQVDRGQCLGQCETAYNNEVVAWESQLAAFNQDARVALQSTNLPRVGIWRKYGEWTQISVAGIQLFCQQTWVCGPAETFMAAPDMKVVGTPSAETVRKLCQAGHTDRECTDCPAEREQPEDRCEWHLEKR